MNAAYRLAVLQGLQSAHAAGFDGLACAFAALLQLEDKRAEPYSIAILDSVKSTQKNHE